MDKDTTHIRIKKTTRKKLRAVAFHAEKSYDEWISEKAEEDIKKHGLKVKS